MYKSVQMARARRLEARGDPPIAISGCSNFAARLAGVKLRAQLPSRRVAAHNLPRHRLALSGQEVGCTQSGRALGLLHVCNRAVEVRHRRIHSLPPRPSGLPTHSQLGVRPRPLPLGQQVTQWLHRERAWTRRHFHDGERAGVQEHGANQHSRVSRPRLRASRVWGDVRGAPGARCKRRYRTGTHLGCRASRDSAGYIVTLIVFSSPGGHCVTE